MNHILEIIKEGENIFKSMEKSKSTKTALMIIFLIIIIIAMGMFIYKLNNEKTNEINKTAELQDQIESLNSTVNELQGKIVETSSTENNELYIIKEINISNDGYLYNFKTKKWVKQIDGAEGMYYIAIDNEKNIYIVDRFENILKKLDVKLEKLRVDDTDVDNYITYVKVSKSDDTLVISTGDEFITFEVSLKNYSTHLAEIGDE